MQFTTVRSKEKDYNLYLKAKKLVHSNQQHEKKVYHLFGSGKKQFLAISILTNTVAAIWREKKWIPAILRIKNVVQNYQEQVKRLSHVFKVRKTGSNQIGARKKLFPSIWKWKKRFLAILSLTNTVAAVWREIKVDPCNLETKKSSSQQLGARKKIMTCI